MNFIGRYAKIFAFLFVFFVNFLSVSGQGSIYRLPAGTKIKLSMDAGISSKISSVNDTFTTTVAKAIRVENVVVLPFGTVIEGRITEASSAGYGGKQGQMQVRFETIRFPNSLRRAIDGILVDELKAGSTRAVSMISIFGGTAAGALIGTSTKTENGALIGAGIGAGAGTAVSFLKKGKDVQIKTGEEFEIELKSEVTLPASDY